MFKPLSLYIGLRYTRAKKQRGFVSFISMVSMLGIALGVMVLITVLSVMNGFNIKVRQEFFAMAPEVTITGPRQTEQDWSQLAKSVQGMTNVTGTAPFVNGQGMLTRAGISSGVLVLGIQPKREMHISQLANKMIAGSLASLSQPGFNVILGRGLAERMGLQVGDRVTLLTPQVSVSLLGAMPRLKRFTVSGIFHAGSSFGFDDSVIFTGFKQASALYSGRQATFGLHVKLKDPYLAQPVTVLLRSKLPYIYQLSNWTVSNGAFFQALALQKTTMFFVLMLIVAVAIFNLVASLMMIVNDKQSDIAILRTIGASPGMIMRSFIIQGALVGFIGTLIGVLAGCLLSMHVTGVVNMLESVLHVQIINSQALYGLDYLPSQLVVSDVAWIAGFALVLSLLATLYPAWTAFRTQPAEALRYE